MKCRSCNNIILEHIFLDLGVSPLSNSLLSKKSLYFAEKFYPLKVYICHACFLVQLEEFESPEHIFSDYTYFSSYSDSWLQHAKAYTDLMIKRFNLDQQSQVIEIASNDGYLLQFFHQNKIPVIGIEPAKNVAEVAQKKGIPTWVKFFGVETAKELVKAKKMADLLLGNNVLAHVPNLHDFVSGLKIVLKPTGTITLEFPHLLRLIEQNQFDTIYHEHFSYFSLISLLKIFEHHALTICDVEELSTHGGSLRIYCRHSEEKNISIHERVATVKQKEIDTGLNQITTYSNFKQKVEVTKRNLLRFLIGAKNKGKSIVAYGAPAKGNTLLNYCGIRTDFIDYTVDLSPHKQGLFLPGTHIPIYSPDKIKTTKPDYLLILPWNLKDEIMNQMKYVREWGCQFIVPIPEIAIY